MINKKNGRIQKLEYLLKQVDRVHLSDAAEILNVSEMTIRRDISSNVTEIVLLGGYLLKSNEKSNNYFLLEQQDKNIIEKMYLGKMAASLVENGDVIFFDCGTTISFVASQIPDSINFTAICCSINTFIILQEKLNCELLLIGGTYSRDNAMLTPFQNQNLLDNICTTKAFIATSGVDPHYGLTCFRLNEAQIKQKAIAKTRKKIIVFDHTKLNKVHSAYIDDINNFNIILCNQSLPSEFNISADNIATNEDELLKFR
ncbi:DNA-binding transcriptional repressor DeoR [Testudinibacter sp. P80/BLE/0925]|uniref:DNA-binding transcriptional repressor DeoR n=1 Tax=Testudinibacter sp. TW-1 TaxID=3417757 RepID=UPI003D35D734